MPEKIIDTVITLGTGFVNIFKRNGFVLVNSDSCDEYTASWYKALLHKDGFTLVSTTLVSTDIAYIGDVLEAIIEAVKELRFNAGLLICGGCSVPEKMKKQALCNDCYVLDKQGIEDLYFKGTDETLERLNAGLPVNKTQKEKDFIEKSIQKSVCFNRYVMDILKNLDFVFLYCNTNEALGSALLQKGAFLVTVLIIYNPCLLRESYKEFIDKLDIHIESLETDTYGMFIHPYPFPDEIKEYAKGKKIYLVDDEGLKKLIARGKKNA